MADWAEWCEIISRCMGEKDNAFINAYNENIEFQIEEIIAGYPRGCFSYCGRTSKTLTGINY